MTETSNDFLLTALRSASPDPGFRPSPQSPEATAMLSRILDGIREPALDRRRRRVTRRRVMLAALPSLAAAVAAVVVTVSVTQRVPVPRPLTPATVRAAVLDALQQDRADILRETVHYQGPGGLAGRTSTSWIYPAFPAVGQRVRYRQVDYSKGKPSQDVESIYTEDEALEHLSMSTTQGPRSAKIVGVDYQTRTWATFTTSTVPVSLTMSPALIHGQIASGKFTVDGTVKLDGLDAVKLHWTQNRGSAAAFRTTMWVDATTYVPLRLVNIQTIGAHISFTTTISFAMIPATGASMKALTPPVPAGFTQAPQLPGYSRIGD